MINKKFSILSILMLCLFSCKNSRNRVCDETAVLINNTCYTTCPEGQDDACENIFYCTEEGYCAPGTNRAPRIDNVNGNGPINTSSSDSTTSPNHIKNGLFISGKNLAAVESVSLRNTQNDAVVYALVFEHISDELLEVSIPEDLNRSSSLDFEMALKAPHGSARALIYFVRGAQGAKGFSGLNGPDHSKLKGEPGANGVNAQCKEQACIGVGFPGASRMMTLKIKAGFIDNSSIVSSKTNNTNTNNSFTIANSVTLLRYNSLSYEQIGEPITYTKDNITNFFLASDTPHSNEIIVGISQGDTSQLLRTQDSSNKTFAYHLTQYGASEALLTLNRDNTFAFIGRNNHIPGTASTHIWDNSIEDNQKSALVFVVENSIFGSNTKRDPFIKTEQLKGLSVSNPTCLNNDVMLVKRNSLSQIWTCAQNSIITSDHLQSNAITTRHWINGAIQSIHIQNDSINDTVIASNTITTNILINQSIIGIHIKNNEIINALINIQSINSNVISIANITGIHIQNNSVLSYHFKDQTLTQRVFTNNVLETRHFSNNSITNRHIQDNNISTGHIQNNTFGQDTFGNIIFRTSSRGLLIASNTQHIFIQSDVFAFKNNETNTEPFSLFSSTTNTLRAIGNIFFSQLRTARIQNGLFISNAFSSNNIASSSISNDAFIQKDTCILFLSSCPEGWSITHPSENMPFYHPINTTNIGRSSTFTGSVVRDISSSTDTHTHNILVGISDSQIAGYNQTGNTTTWFREGNLGKTRRSKGLAEAYKQDDDVADARLGPGEKAFTSNNNNANHTHTADQSTHKIPTAYFQLCCKN